MGTTHGSWFALISGYFLFNYCFIFYTDVEIKLEPFNEETNGFEGTFTIHYNHTANLCICDCNL